MPRETLPDGGLTHTDADQTRVVVTPAWTDTRTGQTYVHKDLVLVDPDWKREEHIGPTVRTERFGDVPSWAEYVRRFDDGASLLTWNSHGLQAVLDYPTGIGEPGRCGWIAEHPFRFSPEWQAWVGFANGRALTQRDAIEKLEDLGEDIVEPPQGPLMLLLRKLRANASAEAETELRPDGTSAITFRKDSKIATDGNAELPPIIQAQLPVLAGDRTPWLLKVRMRVSVDDSAHLTFRFSLVNAERTLDEVYAERVAAAQAALGDERQLLRADG